MKSDYYMCKKKKEGLFCEKNNNKNTVGITCGNNGIKFIAGD